MFSGLVSSVGTVQRASEARGILNLRIRTPLSRSLGTGDSIAVNGVCLTAIRVTRRGFAAQAMEETRSRTTLGALGSGDPVNLELPVRLDDRLGGHLVQGHVDGVAEIVEVTDEPGGSRRLTLSTSEDVSRYLVAKGSVALDGVSLTVVDVAGGRFGVALVPHTLRATTLGSRRPGDRLNGEVDLIAKYVERLVAGYGGR